MKTLLIAYEPSPEQRDTAESAVSDYIKSYPGWAKPLPSAWLVRTDMAPSDVRDEVKNKLGPNGKVLVVDITHAGWASARVDPRVNEWLKKTRRAAS